MSKFIYVFSEEGKDVLLSRGFELIKANEQKKIYVFLNSERKDFVFARIPYVFSDTLTF